jgi:outer membrane protein insertion porin family
MSIRTLAAVAIFAAGWVIGADNTVKEVKVRVLDQFGTEASDVLSFCSVKVGAEVSQEALSKDVRSLLDTGRYGYAGVELEKVADGINVVYVVKRRYRFQGPLSIKGADYFSESKIRKLSELKNGDYIDDPVLSTKAGKIRDEYVKKYFPAVKIGAEIKPIEGSAGSANVVFTIVEGERAKIHKFLFKGNTSIPEEDLRSSFGQRPWYDPRGWFTDTPVSAQDLEDARSQAEEVYKDHGFLDAKVATPVWEKIGKEKANVVFDVTEGDVYNVESTAIRGVKLFPEAEVLSSSKLKANDLAGRKAIDDAAKDVRDYYGGRGYVDTAVRPVIETIEGKPGRVAITFEVREGELAYIRNIVIRGNNKTKDKVIRREVMVSPGEIMNEVRIERSENRLKNLGYFSNVRHYNEKTDDPTKRDLVYEVDEQRTGNFMVGAGFSSIDQLVGFAEVTQSNFDILNWPNFTGGGQKARLGVEAGTRRQTIEASVTEPWFLDRPLALTVEAYRRLRWYDQYDDIRTGADAGLSYPVKVGRVGVRYTLELVQMSDVEDKEWYLDPDGTKDSTPDSYTGDANEYFKYQDDQYGDAINSVVRLYWTHDTRDQAFVPTKGYQATLFGDLYEGAVGDNELYKLGANYRQYFRMPWYKHVLSLRGRLETIDAYGGSGGSDEVPIYEKLFLGGPRTIRGVEYRDVGPKLYSDDGGDHAPLGGQTLSLVTAEYTIPVFKAVRFATFMDAGSLGADAFSPEFSDVCVSFGVGLRIDIPGFPIRFDFAKAAIMDDDYTDDQIFSFAIGFE